ncbi:hypothetical protein LZ32DRAFT_64240 [Colletotrichum eremochloae]|nr:hypothetical protein LZ32DRAFT_64240 [Colletotrichum eremochloae]
MRWKGWRCDSKVKTRVACPRRSWPSIFYFYFISFVFIDDGWVRDDGKRGRQSDVGSTPPCPAIGAWVGSDPVSSGCETFRFQGTNSKVFIGNWLFPKQN